MSSVNNLRKSVVLVVGLLLFGVRAMVIPSDETGVAKETHTKLLVIPPLTSNEGRLVHHTQNNLNYATAEDSSMAKEHEGEKGNPFYKKHPDELSRNRAPAQPTQSTSNSYSHDFQSVK